VKSDLTRAAEILEEEATTIRECEQVNGEWPDGDEWSIAAHRRHDEYLALANRLRKRG
jgi:hypothetical protein